MQSNGGKRREHLSKAVAVHVGEGNVMKYNQKDVEKNEWIVYKVEKVLSIHPKWSQKYSGNDSVN